jgi:hypothetical protein
MIAAIYPRKSTDQHGVSDDEKSATRQVDHACAYAARKGWTVAHDHVYADDGITGSEFENRSGFLRLMNQPAVWSRSTCSPGSASAPGAAAACSATAEVTAVGPPCSTAARRTIYCGTKVCTNKLHLRIPDTDEAILGESESPRCYTRAPLGTACARRSRCSAHPPMTLIAATRCARRWPMLTRGRRGSRRRAARR